MEKKMEELDELMSQHPTLCDLGARFKSKDPAELEADRQALRSKCEQIQEVKGFLDVFAYPRSKTINHSVPSYEMKKFISHKFGQISDGVFISAALLSGLKTDWRFKRNGTSKTSICFNLAKKGLYSIENASIRGAAQDLRL
jgi:hypothetical protein